MTDVCQSPTSLRTTSTHRMLTNPLSTGGTERTTQVSDCCLTTHPPSADTLVQTYFVDDCQSPTRLRSTSTALMDTEQPSLSTRGQGRRRGRKVRRRSVNSVTRSGLLVDGTCDVSASHKSTAHVHGTQVHGTHVHRTPSEHGQDREEAPGHGHGGGISHGASLL